jgi:glycosyltransferase involved in cell wall biosynthesis
MNWDLSQAAKRDKIDMLFCPDYRAPIFYRGNTSIILHDISYEARPNEFFWKSPADKILLKWASKVTSRRAKMIITPSEYSRQEVARLYHIDLDKIFTAHLGPDENIVSSESGSDAEETKKKFGIEKEFIFYIGSIFTRRHVPEIIQAFTQIDRPGCQFVLSGKDLTEGKKIERLIHEANSKLGRKGVLKIGFVEDSELRSLYGACSFVIWLSDYEGFGLPVVEAMANGAPVITSQSSSLTEVAGDATILIKNNSDVGEIKSAMEKLFKDGDLRQELIRKGKEQAKKFSWQNCAKITLNAITRN